MEGYHIALEQDGNLVKCPGGRITATCRIRICADVLEGVFVMPDSNCSILGAILRTRSAPLAFLPGDQLVVIGPGTIQIPFVSTNNMCWPLRQTAFDPTFVTVIFSPITPPRKVRFGLHMYFSSSADTRHQADHDYQITGNGFTSTITTGGGMVTGQASSNPFNPLFVLPWTPPTEFIPLKRCKCIPNSVSDRMSAYRRSLRSVFPHTLHVSQ